MAGDSAGVLPPFLGVGVAAALASGLRCGRTVAACLRGDLEADEAVAQYDVWWRSRFRKTARWGGWASALLCRPSVGAGAIRALNTFPTAGRLFYAKTRTDSPSNRNRGVDGSPRSARFTGLGLD